MTTLFSSEFKKKAVQLANRKSVTEAAYRLGISANTLSGWVTAANRGEELPPSRRKNHRSYTKAFKQKAIHLATQLGSVLAAAEHVGMPYRTLHKWCKEKPAITRGADDPAFDDMPVNEAKEEAPQDNSSQELKRIAQALERIASCMENGIKFL